jgi:glycogen synthase
LRVLHILHRSVPGTHGYAMRSTEIVRNQLRKGVEPLVITSPSQAPMGPLDGEGSEYIEGIRYFRTGGHLLPPSVDVRDTSKVRAILRVLQNVSMLTKALSVARRYRSDLVHGHSPFTCGLVADAIGTILGIPSVYEMRGIWEDSHVARRKIEESSPIYGIVRFLENRALRGADLCCFICESLKQEVLDRGIVDESRTLITPNGVDVKRFIPGPADEDLKQRLGLSGARVVGYVGTFFLYEGLDLLLEAMIRVFRQYSDVRLLLVGDGELMPRLREGVAHADAEDRVVFTGLVAHDQVSRHYSICDLMVLPRRDTRETHLVTPLKPMEIMAMAKPLVASDIGGHRDSVIDGVNGMLFRSEDVTDLGDKLVHLIEHPETGEAIAARSRIWVEENRDWNVLVERYISAYSRLLGEKN